ncbi:L10-interacting MYB domain-containing protein-like [Forsythia ovata]|uniref:L10-interacting MYB domain-containing protein-like n=1 Tax=Forsythia ovata TaxID=205694 RepID=A0ABD1WUE1_9LAMI
MRARIAISRCLKSHHLLPSEPLFISLDNHEFAGPTTPILLLSLLRNITCNWHLDIMKSDWIVFKQLIQGETVIGWDDTRKTIVVDDHWWNHKIKADDKYKKFREIKRDEGEEGVLYCDHEKTGEIGFP